MIQKLRAFLLRWTRPAGRATLSQIQALLGLLLLLLVADNICYQQALPVVLDWESGEATLRVGSQGIALGQIAAPVSLKVPEHDPLVHEYQLDGTDSTNNFSLDAEYLKGIAASPYYIFQSWMRNLDGTSRWSDVLVSSDDQVLVNEAWPDIGESFSFEQQTTAAPVHLQIRLRRPETSRTLNVTLADGSVIEITLDRNNRKLSVARDSEQLAKAFFPVDVLPLAAMVVDTLVRTVAWAIVILLVVLLCEMALALIRPMRGRPRARAKEDVTPRADPSSGSHAGDSSGGDLPAFLGKTSTRLWRALTAALHPIALVALLVSLLFVAWISKVQYHAEPHIYDGSAYRFAAKMYASGHLWVPTPSVPDRFPGPFMVRHEGRWFAQYAPGTSLTLTPGIWLGVPWLVEPLLGTLALLGIGLIAARLFDRRVATLAVVLGTLSPFYSYIAASYLSHAVALFYLTWGFWALLRYFQGEATWNLPLAVFFFGMGYLTRNEPALLFGGLVFLGLVLLFWRARDRWRLKVQRVINTAVIACLFLALNLQFNLLLTNDPLKTPRSLFYAPDHWGFGEGVGFYGQHTVAAGLANMDELLTILAIDLYGWPFYFTLAFIALPFITRRAAGADWFCLVCLALLSGAYIGYFYHGIYLGPRYLFETLPFLLMLTARGVLALDAAGRAARNNISTVIYANGKPPRVSWSIPTVILVASLVLCNLLYFLPRQIVLHQDFTALGRNRQLELPSIYHPPLHNAVIVTGDGKLYGYVLFPLNDPLLRGDVLYALARNEDDYRELRTAFPGRDLYLLKIAEDGSVTYEPIAE